MPDQKNNDPNQMDRIRTYLETKSKDGLVTLLLNLVQSMDEPTRQQFWDHLAPPGMATADLRYPSADDFLKELTEFHDAVIEGENIGIVSQTTQNVDDFNEFVSRYKEAVYEDTICEATKKRQESSRELAKKSDIMIMCPAKPEWNGITPEIIIINPFQLKRELAGPVDRNISLFLVMECIRL